MRSLLSRVIPAILVFTMPSLVLAGDLAANDYVGVTFWIISIAMVASTVFFL